MTEYQVSRPLRRQPTHPGMLMREILDEQIKLSLAEVNYDLWQASTRLRRDLASIETIETAGFSAGETRRLAKRR